LGGNPGRIDMSLWDAVLWGVIIVSGLASLYGLHRLGLWLEQLGWLFNKHKAQQKRSYLLRCSPARTGAADPARPSCQGSETPRWR